MIYAKFWAEAATMLLPEYSKWRKN